MTDTINAGTYKVGEILQHAGFDFQKEAAADYLDGQPDHRRVKIGSLGFDSLDDVIVIPPSADVLEIVVDGKLHTSLDVKLANEEQRRDRELAFSVGDASDTGDSGRVARLDNESKPPASQK